MKTAVLDPGMLFISDEDWADVDKRASFLEHLAGNLAAIDRHRVAKILWDGDLEECLWSYPQKLPWRQDASLRVPLGNVIRQRLQRNRLWLEESNDLHPSKVSPGMTCCDANASEVFLFFMHRVISSYPGVILCLGRTNADIANMGFTFSCDDCQLSLTPGLVSSPDGWLGHMELDDESWYRDASVLADALEITRQRHLSGETFLYQSDFSQQFMDAVRQATMDKTRILEQMARRLTLTTQQAGNDSSLQDEPLKRNKQLSLFTELTRGVFK